MGTILTSPKEVAPWYALVNDAQYQVGCQLPEDIESYLVFLLMRYTRKREMAGDVLSIGFMEALRSRGLERKNALKDVGDTCLLYAGLFPKRARRLRVPDDYFANLGRGAYHVLSSFAEDGFQNVYADLSGEFVFLSRILAATRTVEKSLQ
ncbi:MAG: hypothetical protein NUV53_02975 [Patescibacteria group bacterium]|nr:hypothetical protein [Patescibacteria group bacterium]